jgi:hypothetical protein
MSTFRRFLAMLDEGINSDEDVIFYPSIGIHPAGGSRCEVEVRGRITEESHLDLADFALTLAGVPDINALTDFLGHVKSARDENDSSRLFTERVKHFVLDGESEEQFPIRIGDTSAASVRSGSHGFFGFLVPRLTVPASAAAAAVQGHTGQWLSYTATSGNGRTFTGKSLLLRARGVIVVSDIDDTIKDSNVPEPHELVANTLFRPYRHTPGMPETFQAWAAIGADFVYLSNSPYQLYEPLTDYLQRQVGFPEGA